MFDTLNLESIGLIGKDQIAWKNRREWAIRGGEIASNSSNTKGICECNFIFDPQEERGSPHNKLVHESFEHCKWERERQWQHLPKGH
jgi:hypothetical protein